MIVVVTGKIPVVPNSALIHQEQPQEGAPNGWIGRRLVALLATVLKDPGVPTSPGGGSGTGQAASRTGTRLMGCLSLPNGQVGRVRAPRGQRQTGRATKVFQQISFKARISRQSGPLPDVKDGRPGKGLQGRHGHVHSRRRITQQ